MFLDPLYAFVFAGLFSPGPNVILITASGARFGFRRTIPHIAGVVTGVGIIAGLAGFGIAVLLAARPGLELVLKLGAAAWILWMARTLWRSTGASKNQDQTGPFSFFEAVLFQWINPKIWAVALAASSGYSRDASPSAEAARLAFAFSSINSIVCVFWCVAGSLLAILLRSQASWTVFMRALAVFLAFSALMVFL